VEADYRSVHKVRNVTPLVESKTLPKGRVSCHSNNFVVTAAKAYATMQKMPFNLSFASMGVEEGAAASDSDSVLEGGTMEESVVKRSMRGC